ncbi:hypothetical protein [Cupriavidus sp. CP313]
MSRYIGRAAIFNKRLVTQRPEQVRTCKTMTLEAAELMLRFFQGRWTH